MTEQTTASRPVEGFVMLPCPFCGEQPHGVFGPNEETGLWRVECFGQDYGCGDWTIEAGSRDEVREAWNHRDWQGASRQDRPRPYRGMTGLYDIIAYVTFWVGLFLGLAVALSAT